MKLKSQYLLLCFLFLLALVGCGGGSGGGGNNGSSSTPTQPSNTLTMQPKTSIKMGRNLNVLFLYSHASDQRALTESELRNSFEVTKKILNYNGIINNYSLTFDSYVTNKTSQQLRDISNKENKVPEADVLSRSTWLTNDTNKAKINAADIVILRTSFSDNKDNSLGYWGAAASQIGFFQELKNIQGLRSNVKLLYSPVNPSDTSDSGQYEHNSDLDAEFQLSSYDRVLAHEFIHALGYGAHDEGVDEFKSESFSTKITTDLNYSSLVGSQLAYGDNFSIMGDAEYSLMLSPSAKEALGAKLDSIDVYSSKTVKILKPQQGKQGQVLKIFLQRDKSNNSPDDIVTYLTLDAPDLSQYGKSLNGDIERGGATHSLQENTNGFIVRLVKTNIALESTIPFSVLLDAFPPMNNYTYTLQKGHSITVGNKVTIELLSDTASYGELKITYI